MNARERLISSTQALLWEIGYVAMSPKTIQLRAKVGQGSMYHHFAGKADLAVAALELSSASFCERADEVLSAQGSPLERLRAYMSRTRDALKGCQIGKLCQDPEILSSLRLRKPLDSAFRWLQGRLQKLIEEAKSAGELAAELDAANAAVLLISVIQGGYVLAAARKSAEPFDRAIAGALQFLERKTRPSRRRSTGKI